MRKSVLYAVMASLMIALSGLAAAKLPAPTPEQAKSKQETAAKKAKADEAAKQALARAQDRVAARYKARKR